MVVGGGILMATGVGGPLGLALVSGGADVIIQKATTGKANWAQAAASTVLGGVGGAAPLLLKATRVGGMATQASLRVAPTANVVKSLAVNMGVNGGVGAGMSAIGYGVGSAIDGEEMSDRGLAGAMLGGFVGGVVGGVAGPAGGSIAEHLGKPTSSLISTLASSGVGAAGGVSGVAVTNLVAGKATSWGDLAVAAGVGGVMPVVKLGPQMTQTNFDVLRRMPYQQPRTFEGAFVNWSHQNTTALWGSAGIGASVGSTIDTGWGVVSD